MITRNGKELVSVHWNGKELTKLSKGGKEGYSNNKVIYLGNAQSFNIKNVYDKWNELSVDNFFFLSATSNSTSSNVGWVSGDIPAYFDIRSQLQKSYSNGTLNARMWLMVRDRTYGFTSGDQYSNVRMVLVTKPEKLISLGTGQSFNVSNISGYQDFTEDNFLIKSGGMADTGGLYGTGAHSTYRQSGSGALIKTYNASTGVLTCYQTVENNWKANVQVYLAKRGIE